MRRLVSGLLLTLLIVNILALGINVKPAKSSPSTITVPDYYPTIQEAINAASDGDTIFVRNGTYCENVFVNKTLSLVGEDPENTIIDGGGVGNVIHVTVDGVNVSGFTVRNGSSLGDAGIYLDHVSNCSVRGNNITNNGDGVLLDSSSNNNSVSGNNITANNYNGIDLYSSSSNSVSGNNITASNWEGIYLESSSSYNSVSGNNIANNGAGIALSSSSDNNVSGNNITNNRYGIDLDSSSSNTIFHNNFANYFFQVYSSGLANTWDDGYPGGGNYWSDYHGTDWFHGPSQKVFGSDGIGDTPYVIDAQNQDNYPLMTAGGSLTMGSSAGGGHNYLC